MAMEKIPTKINLFNMYNAGSKLVGITGEVSIPNFEAMSETVEGAGILGEIDDVAVGHFGSMEMEIPFRMVDDDAIDLLNPLEATNLTLRAAQQVSTIDGGTDFKQMRVVLRGKNKGFTPGKVQQGKAMNSSVKVEVQYILIELNNKPMVELDKLNTVFKIRGKDILSKAREMV